MDNDTSTAELVHKSAEIRLKVLETALHARKGHVPPAFSWVEIGVALFYGGMLQLRPTEPDWPGRDRFVLSKGHGCLTLYAILSDLGFFPKDELKRFCEPGSMLAGHPDPHIPGVEAVSGSLGHGLGIGAGMALGLKIDGRDSHVYVLLGDGECQEGSVWEAAMFASHHRLSNLVAIIDRNKLGATDYTENSLSLEPFDSRWQAFGWEVEAVNGHSFQQLRGILTKTRHRDSMRPLAIIADTTKGKGVSFMEGSPLWHHRMPKGEEITSALEELKGAQRQHKEMENSGR
jgi:transketolase